MIKMTSSDIQHVSLDILKDVHTFCVNHNINYTLFGGTLIGAIRHNGFIPWDDDVDIAMPRPDYDRFVNEYYSNNGFELFARERQKHHVYLAYARVCDMERSFVDTSHYPWSTYETGVWIDVFPLDGMPCDAHLAKRRTEKANRIFQKTNIARSIMARSNTKGNLIRSIKVKLMKCFLPYFKQWDRLIRVCKAIDYDTTRYYSNLSFGGYGIKEYCSKDVLKSYLLHQFEDSFFQIMEGYDFALTCKYGDYMTPPPKEMQRGFHSYDYYWKALGSINDKNN